MEIFRTFSSVFMLASFAFFIAVVAWACRPGGKRDFEIASQLPFDEPTAAAGGANLPERRP
jgi:cbb3-type cytochrome oxidase subunit 3